MTAFAVQAAGIVVAAMARSFWISVPFYLISTVAWGLMLPVKQSWMNSLIPSEQRATLISLDSLFGDAGGTVGQVGLGYASQAVSIPFAWLLGGLFQLTGIPLIFGRAAGGRGNLRQRRRAGRLAGRQPTEWPRARDRRGPSRGRSQSGAGTGGSAGQLLGRRDISLGECRILIDRVPQESGREPGRDGQGGHVDPLAGQRPHGPGAHHDAAVRVHDQPQQTARLLSRRCKAA